MSNGEETTNPRHRVPVRRDPDDEGNGTPKGPREDVFTADWHYESRGDDARKDHQTVSRGHHWARTLASVVLALAAVGGIIYAGGRVLESKTDEEDVEKAVIRHEKKTQHPETRRQIRSIRDDVSEMTKHQAAIDERLKSIDKSLKRISDRIRPRRRRRRAPATE